MFTDVMSFGNETASKSAQKSPGMHSMVTAHVNVHASRTGSEKYQGGQICLTFKPGGIRWTDPPHHCDVKQAVLVFGCKSLKKLYRDSDRHTAHVEAATMRALADDHD